ncbi:hypothetical protein R1flu_022523 [Riccia fluitans]|uniref:Glycosyltransferase 61 catalytic domain-containing protein n=1 Tax=Riccia fluitans TaxID=41844 RepID=A0ABD1XSC1_9MARC
MLASHNHKVLAGQWRGFTCTFWTIGALLFVMCLQLAVYERKWFEHYRTDDSEQTLYRFPESSKRIVENAEENLHELRVLDESSTLREIMDVIASCSADPSAEVEADTAECLQKLLTEYPALTALHQQVLRLGDGSLPQRSSEQNRLDGLERKVVSLGLMLESSNVFLELKDTREPGLSDESHWFMSTVKVSDQRSGFPEEFQFPSELSQGRILCFMGNSTHDGTENKYGFAYRDYLPRGSTLLPGLTLVADSYWDYTNIWHGMSALVNFISIRTRENCVVPERLLLFHWGEVVPSMASWVDELLHASFGKKLELEKLDRGRDKPVCLERAIVNRRGLGGMSVPNMNILFDSIRCRSYKFCGVHMPQTSTKSSIHITLLLRTGARAWKNATSVKEVIHRQCQRLDLCTFEASYIDNLTFCQQVALMSRTDVLVSTHGAQLTNMMFMPKGSYVMEMMPKGWLEFAGVGQYIYSWLAEWTNLNHGGVWHDTEGPDCPYDSSETLKCFLFFKDRTVDHNQTQLAEWTSTTLEKAKLSKQKEMEVNGNRTSVPPPCPCEDVDNFARAVR